MDSKPFSRKNIRLQGFDYRGSCFVYFITLCSYERSHILTQTKTANILISAFNHQRNEKIIKLYCYCIMPDHLHLLMSLSDFYPHNLQTWIRSFKRFTAKSAKTTLPTNQLWQKNFYDHIIRKEESFIKIAEYILNNPVRGGLVGNWKDYPYSKIIDEFPF